MRNKLILTRVYISQICPFVSIGPAVDFFLGHFSFYHWFLCAFLSNVFDLYLFKCVPFFGYCRMCFKCFLPKKSSTTLLFVVETNWCSPGKIVDASWENVKYVGKKAPKPRSDVYKQNITKKRALQIKKQAKQIWSDTKHTQKAHINIDIIIKVNIQ